MTREEFARNTEDVVSCSSKEDEETLAPAWNKTWPPRRTRKELSSIWEMNRIL
jgi:hypothetical protein